MFTEVLKITPKLDGKDLNAMEQSLNGRFKNIAKKFGGGLLDIIKGGGIAGIALGLIDKLLNPLKEVQESIEKSLHTGEDLATFAKQFNTTAGNLARLQGFAKATGLDPEGLRVLLEKFQSSVAKSAADPGTKTSTSNFVGKQDIAESFFEFIQSMQKLTPIQRNLVEQEVFGERQILKASEFLGANFKELSNIFNAAGVPSASSQTAAATWLAKLQENRNTLGAVRDQKDLVNKGRLIGDHNINGLEASDDLNLSQENKNLGKFDSLQRISIENQKLINLAVNQFLKLAPLVAQILPLVVDNLGGATKAVESSRALRGLVPGAGKEK